MQHRIVFQEITRQDINTSCRYMPPKDEFAIFFSAFANDVERLQGVTEVIRDGTHAIVVKTDATLDVLKEWLVPLLRHYWERLRIEL